METFILIILFYLFLAFVSFVIVYADDTADIANDDFESYEPSINDLSEEERADYCIVDGYIKDTICPRYHHQILKNEIDHYQNDESCAPSLAHFLMINLVLSVIPLKIVRIWSFFSYLIAFVIGCVCFFVVKLLYEKYSSARIKNYYEIHSSYDWHSHYRYLLYIKEKVVFRHTLRKFITLLAVLCYLGFAGLDND